MSSEHKKSVCRQFSDSATRYVRSHVHAKGGSLELVVRLAGVQEGDLVLDVATGAGHTALALASKAGAVVAVDISRRMLEVARALAVERGVSNVYFIVVDAEALSFRDESFAVVTSRIAPHHFPNPAAFVREVGRVLKPGGRFVLADTWAPSDPKIDAFINRIQLLRDPTHRRSLSTPEWEAAVRGAGLDISFLQTGCVEGERSFNEWVSISRTPADRVEALKSLLSDACAEVREAIQLRVTADDIFFQIPRIVLSAVK